MAKRKYLTEFAFQTYREFGAVTTPYDLSIMPRDQIRELGRYKIYFVCKRPKVIAQNIQKTGDTTYTIDFLFKAAKPKTLQINLNLKSFDDRVVKATSLLLTGPQNRFLQIHFESGPPSKISIAAYIQLFSSQLNIPEIQPLEVIYIGKSHADGYSIYDRLTAHSTIQTIGTQVNVEYPDDELVFYLFSFQESRYLLTMNPRHQTETSDKEDESHLKKVINTNFEPKHQTVITEASFIRYFRPKYNDQLKDSFPSTNLKLLKKCYKLDLASIIAEINTDDLGASFYSPDQKASYFHIAQFDLHDLTERMSFFTI